MAAGKSTIGKSLARTLETAFYDLDHIIESRHGSIASIFERGEPEFRGREFEAISHLFETENRGVIALGGGAVTHSPTAELLGRNAYTIFLNVPLERIQTRLRKSHTVRPLAGDDPDPRSIAALYAQRLPQYRKADLTVDTRGRSNREIVGAITAWMKAQSITL